MKVISWPNVYVIHIRTGNTDATRLIADAIRELRNMRRPWYGFRILAGASVWQQKWIVSVKVYNTDGDLAGIQYNAKRMKLRELSIHHGWHFKSENEERHMLFLAKVA
jgi:hypothetical protein